MDSSEEYQIEELSKLAEEIEDLKVSIKKARETANDANYEQLTGHLEPLEKTKFQVIRRLNGHLSKVTSFVWSHESTRIVSVAQDGKLIHWEAANGNKLHLIPLKTVWITACGISPDDSISCSGGLDNLVSLHKLNPASEQPVKEIVGHGGYISKCRFLNSQQILSSSGDCRSILWDAATGRSICEFIGHTKDVSSFDFSSAPSSQNQFITSSMDGTCRSWDVRTAQCTQIMDAPVDEAEINDIALFPESQYGFICVTEQGSCHLWDLRADQPVADFYDQDAQNPCTSVTISKSGRIFFVGQDDGVCRIYDVLLQEPVTQLTKHNGRISGVGVSFDGQALVTASWDTKLLLYVGKVQKHTF